MDLVILRFRVAFLSVKLIMVFVWRMYHMYPTIPQWFLMISPPESSNLRSVGWPILRVYPRGWFTLSRSPRMYLRGTSILQTSLCLFVCSFVCLFVCLSFHTFFFRDRLTITLMNVDVVFSTWFVRIWLGSLQFLSQTYPRPCVGRGRAVEYRRFFRDSVIRGGLRCERQQ